MPFRGANSEFGESEMLRWFGDGVDIGDPYWEFPSPSDRGRPPRTLPLLPANAAAVAAAASSTVPVW